MSVLSLSAAFSLRLDQEDLYAISDICVVTQCCVVIHFVDENEVKFQKGRITLFLLWFVARWGYGKVDQQDPFELPHK
jgi:hypothetical protein